MDLSILFVDDEVEAIELYVKYFKRHCFNNVSTAGNAQSAIEHIENHKPDLVFLDICLGDDSRENGIDILKRVRVSVPECKVCMMSADRDEYERQSLDMGAYAFIAKPFSPDRLQTIAMSVSK